MGEYDNDAGPRRIAECRPRRSYITVAHMPCVGVVNKGASESAWIGGSIDH